MKRFSTVLLVLSIFVLGACVEGCGKEYKIEPATKTQIDLINSALDSGHSVGRASYIKSEHHNCTYYIGATIYTLDKGSVLTLWATNVGPQCKSVGLLFSVNELAYELSGMGKGENTKAKVRRSDPEAQALIRYFNLKYDY